MEEVCHRQVVGWLLIGILAILAMLGCSGGNVTADAAALPAPVIPTFTYTTYGGAIWQVDVNGRKWELLPADGVHKLGLRWSPGRQWLSYLAIDLTQVGTRVEGLPNNGETIVPIYRSERTLMVMEADGTPLNIPLRGAASVSYLWEDSHTIRLWLSDMEGATPYMPWAIWEEYTIDVQANQVAEIITTKEEWRPLTPLTPAPGPSYSPDREWAMQFEREGEDYLLDGNGNKIATIPEKMFAFARDFSWSPNSQYLLYRKYSSQESYHYDVYVYDVKAKTSIQLTNFPEEAFHSFDLSPRWSPTGEWIFFERHLQPCLVHITNRELHCFQIRSKGGGYFWSSDGRYLATIAPAGSDPVDVYMIDAVQNELVNLTQDGDTNYEHSLAWDSVLFP